MHLEPTFGTDFYFEIENLIDLFIRSAKCNHVIHCIGQLKLEVDHSSSERESLFL